MKNISRFIALATTFVTPIFVAAQTSGGLNVNALVPYKNSILSIINGIIVPVLFAIAFLYFVYGVYKYFILGATEEAAKGEGRQFALWSLVGFAVILSVWGLVNVVTSTFNLSGVGAPPSYPTL